jgi:membrane-bound serine protease (ClpP class)
VLTLGLILVFAALLLGLAEAHVSTGGLIASAGAIALLCGVALTTLGAGAGVATMLALLIVAAVASGGGLLLLARRARAVRRLRPRAGVEAMVGRIGTVRAIDGVPRVFVDGSLWRAQPGPLELAEGRELRDGERVVVEHVNGLTVSVRKAEEWELQPW